MCTCDAFTFRSCKWEHSKFVARDTCLAVRMGLRERCRQRKIMNGHPNVPRAWPSIDGICSVCHPAEAAAEEEEKKQRQKQAEANNGSSSPVTI